LCAIAILLEAWCRGEGSLVLHPGDIAQMKHFMKNIAMIGGLIFMTAFRRGRIALDLR
jgi:uncharacterized membrane protein YphA (DoxX/SURF4 family)